jgi:hypothetical protein
MQGNVADMIRSLMETQQLSVRKVSARIAEKHGGSAHGYTQQISRILNDPSYDPSLSTVGKILSALNVSLWQVNSAATSNSSLDAQSLVDRLDHLSAEVADLKLGLAALHQSIAQLINQGEAIHAWIAAEDTAHSENSDLN